MCDCVTVPTNNVDCSVRQLNHSYMRSAQVTSPYLITIILWTAKRSVFVLPMDLYIVLIHDKAHYKTPDSPLQSLAALPETFYWTVEPDGLFFGCTSWWTVLKIETCDMPLARPKQQAAFPLYNRRYNGDLYANIQLQTNFFKTDRSAI